MNRLRASFAWFVAFGGLFAGLVFWNAAEARRPTDFIGFTAEGYACPIYVEAKLGAHGVEAAEFLRTTLAQAAGRPPIAFPIRVGDWTNSLGRGVYLSVAAATLVPRGEKLDYPARYASTAGRLRITSRSSEAMQAAVSWFLERELGAHWFIPGPLGAAVPRRESFRLSAKSAQFSPSFVSRNFSSGGSAEEKAWFARNRLNSLFDHGHSMGRIFKREDLLATPELAPLIGGKRFTPREGDTNSWQPNLASPLAAPYAAEVLKQWLRESPDRLAVPLCMNDTVGYDQSPETLELVGHRGYFRERPDYSNLVFGFVNAVARDVAREFPDRYVTTYAYDWTENTPDFRMEPNVVPYLTSDRIQWFDPKFKAEDQELIRRWVAAGPRVVGIYDYLYGVTFLVPRPALAAVTESIPFAHETGVRAYYAESSPNWGLDGPKAWLAAQLLWDARQDPVKLLDTYYREFWQAAGPAMREFDRLTDAQWLSQPLPSYWLKYFKEEHQYLLFPAEVRRKLRAQLAAAAELKISDLVRARLRMVSEAFTVTEAFAEYCEDRDTLTRELLVPATADWLALTGRYLDAKHRFRARHAAVRKEFPLALHGLVMPEFTRNEPLGGALERIAKLPPSEFLLAALARWSGAFPEVAELLPAKAAAPTELISADPTFSQVTVATEFDTTTLEWTKSGPWRGHGFPAEHRSVIAAPAATGQTIRWSGCLEETFSQWLPAEPGVRYRASARVRAKVSPGTLSFLALYRLDQQGKFVDLGIIQRVPVGEWNEEVELSVTVRAPKDGGRIGIAMRTLCQVGDDYLEFSQLELRAIRD